MTELFNLKRKVEQYKDVLNNTVEYRKVWKETLREFIADQLISITKQVELEASVVLKSEVDSMEAIVLSLGDINSGIAQQIGNTGLERQLVKHNGSLIYQQLFNGKVIVLIQLPMIEGYGEPTPPKQVGIYRPEELTEPFFVRHVEDFMREVVHWEDYDDDEPNQNQQIGFNLNFKK